jgi:hypothetical protein
MKTGLLAVLLVAGILAICLPISAHHGNQAYDSAHVEIKDVKVTDFLWANPHCIVRFDAKDENGKVTHWTAEMTSPSALSLDGFTKTLLKPGDVITIDITVSKTGNPVGWIRGITFADGSIWKSGQRFQSAPQR